MIRTATSGLGFTDNYVVKVWLKEVTEASETACESFWVLNGHLLNSFPEGMTSEDQKYNIYFN